MEILCAAGAGVMARIICHPLDTMKTVAFTGFPHDSVGAGRANAGTFCIQTFRRIAQTIWQREGLLGFYRGVGVAVSGSAPGVALFLSSYECSQNLAKRHITERSDSHLYGIPQALIHLSCGFFAESVSCSVWVPIDVAKERLQSQPPSQAGRYTGSWNALLTILRYEGVRGLYKGYWSTLASFGPFSAVYFACYEAAYGVFTTSAEMSASSSALCAGGVGNLVACLLTNPLELVKTRLQVQRAVLRLNGQPAEVRSFPFLYKGLADGLHCLVKDEGVGALWKGVCIRALYTAPNAALTMCFYSALKTSYGTASQG
ncbi:putative Mitochondrial carrier protein [Trypanosoma vivax]|uniref:Putative mitochondrial carrier protein n=1 Tax=Trypanosoma vivax (strain Y486) TaxID=1055687 RepID=G0U330_TRYVY|nr:putative Mitochondrial carrier protein [Trypanosoma vivax]CCC50685.1 putative mitochondrial carrier protein [Trypanosoma vivax Y486]